MFNLCVLLYCCCSFSDRRGKIIQIIVLQLIATLLLVPSSDEGLQHKTDGKREWMEEKKNTTSASKTVARNDKFITQKRVRTM